MAWFSIFYFSDRKPYFFNQSMSNRISFFKKNVNFSNYWLN
ncbi:hypothetical protein C943_01873 [Mariniradius saccharolyticus AK6]|uniref:Uncharacterized protein n=1 Tax=Mariniradius saccharolyticus AK6 TaxID=1239962 RepID=M7XSV3_9BACT|nr:hypothetical protein C943_01873 [Mariniradius saccharolyticus AK6]